MCLCSCADSNGGWGNYYGNNYYSNGGGGGCCYDSGYNSGYNGYGTPKKSELEIEFEKDKSALANPKGVYSHQGVSCPDALLARFNEPALQSFSNNFGSMCM